MKSETIIRIMQAVEHARKAHPWPSGYSNGNKLSYTQQEVNEMAAAMLKGNKRQTVNEAYDAIGILVRIAEGDGEEQQDGIPESHTPS